MKKSISLSFSAQATFLSARSVIALATICICLTSTTKTHAAIDFFQTGASGSGSQSFYAASNPISGVMSANVPLFNPALGTLLQADFEFAASTTGTWYSSPATSGISSIALSGPADVNGQSMGTLSIGFIGAINNVTPSNDYNAAFANLTVTSGAFFNTLTGIGTIPMNWAYSGTSTLDTPAIGAGPGNEGFAWGGSVHVTYFYEPVPEPSTLIGTCAAGIGLVLVLRRKQIS